MRFSGSPYSFVIVALSALVLAGCSTYPYRVAAPKDLQRQLKLVRETQEPPYKQAISLCYSRSLNTPEDLVAEAQLICGRGQVEFLESDTFWTPCSIQQPARATFLCHPIPATSSPQ